VTRAEADEFVSEYDDAVADYRIELRMSTPRSPVAFAKMNACRERLLDALTGEEAAAELPTQVSR